MKNFKIGDKITRVPLIQGGMGVGISLGRLAGSVAKAGGVGIISTAQIGYREEDFDRNPAAANERAIAGEMKKAREISGDGIIGYNIMVALKEYASHVKAAVKASADIIISGAGLPLDLPGVVAETENGMPGRSHRTMLAPIVSSPRALSVVTKYWMKKYDRKPDFLVAEGPLAGGHLGFKREELDAYTPENYERELTAMIRQAAELEIPLIAAGGIYDRRDLEHCLYLGAAGVQMGTRFVTTEECDAADAYKQAYLSARKEDIVIVKSPVGMPGRAIQNAFLEKVAAGERFMSGCRHCIKTCDPKTAPYCITRALINAATGDVDNGLLFCGSNAWRAQKIERTVDIMEEMA